LKLPIWVQRRLPPHRRNRMSQDGPKTAHFRSALGERHGTLHAGRAVESSTLACLLGSPSTRALRLMTCDLNASSRGKHRIAPDIQYIIRPSGMQSIDNALLAGVLVYLTF
jgi:hypothetical protein